jgi:aminoglycoside/choline kinase family phosphotransferase
MRVPTGGGLVYFKAVFPALRYEPGLTRLLAEHCPEHIPQVLALNTDKGWMLTADMGSPLRGSLRASKDLSLLREALPFFAELQIEMIPYLDEMARLGAPLRPLAGITAGYQQILADKALLSSSEYALTVEQQVRLHDLLPQVAQLAADVEAAGLPLTLHHDDFHDANIFLKGDRIIFSDWGDCVLTHPFFSLLILMRSVSDSLETTEDSPDILSLRDAYLEPWTAFTGRRNLSALFAQTWRLGMLNRVFSWYRFLAQLEEPYRTQYAYTVPGWLQDFLEEMDR